MPEPVRILLIEDNPADAELTEIGLRQGRITNHVDVVEDGYDALRFLRCEEGYEDAQRPHLILLDLNLPGMTGHEVLAAIKEDPELSSIPVVMLTSSERDEDVKEAYARHANSFATKPLDAERFMALVTDLTDYWFTVVKLP